MNKLIRNDLAARVGIVLVAVAVHYLDAWLFDSCVIEGCDVHTAWVPLALAGISAVGKIAGGVMANKSARKQRRALEAKQRRLDAWRDAALGSDYLSRADSQAALRTVRENIDEQLKAADISAIKEGMTDEARAAYASRLNRGYADVVSQIAGMGEKYRDRVRDMYMQQSNAIDDAKMGLSSTSGSQNFVDAITGATSALVEYLGSKEGSGETDA